MTTSRPESDAHPTADLVVVGAGPAGLAAALAAVREGATVALVDAESVVGGQFWRHPASPAEAGAVTDGEVAGLHHDLATYRDLRGRLASAAASGRLVHLAGHEVWSVQQIGPAGNAAPDPAPGPRFGSARFLVNCLVRGPGRPASVTIRAHTLLLATGAFDLQLPFPGWDLPGVMTAGGVQSLLKGHGVLAGHRVVVAGTGPFLLSVASGLARGGAAVVGVYEAARPTRWLRDLRSLTGAGGKVMEGMGYARDLVRHRVPYRTGWTVLAADGTDRLESVTVAPLDASGRARRNRARTLAADVLAVGWGFVPQADLAVSLGCDAVPDPNGLPVVVVDAAGRTSVPGVYAAGELIGVGGSALAGVEGELAGTAAAAEITGRLGEGVDRARTARLLRRRRSLAGFAAALHRAYPVPSGWLAGIVDDTLVCRCEEVTAGAIRRVAAQDGVADGRTAKLLVRPGMGWCQGRICGYPTHRLAQEAARALPARGGGAEGVPVPVTERPVAVPVPLGLVARGDRSSV
jgi:thioredoxin reductase